MVVRVQAGHEGSARGGAYGLGDVGVFKDEAAFCQCVLMRRLYPVVAVTPQGVRALLVADEEQDVRLFWHGLLLFVGEVIRPVANANIAVIG